MIIRFVKNNIVVIISICVLIMVPFVISKVADRYVMKEKAMEKLKVEESKRNTFDGNNFVTDTYPIMKDIVMIGDSYAHFLVFDVGFDFVDYSCPGLTLYQLRHAFEAASECKKKYAVVFIGPNDFMAHTPASEFKRLLSEYVDMLREKMGAKVILSTYMHSLFTDTEEKVDERCVAIDEYNKQILDLIDEKNGVYYLDISMLNDFAKYGRDNDNDKLHFNYEFNVAYINKLYDLLLKIRKDEINNG